MLASDKVSAANTLSVIATDTDVLDGNDLTRLATRLFKPLRMPLFMSIDKK